MGGVLMELYYIIAVTDRDRAGEMAELYQAAGLHLTLTKLGRGTAPREALSIYGLDATPKAIVDATPDSANHSPPPMKMNSQQKSSANAPYTSPFLHLT